MGLSFVSDGHHRVAVAREPRSGVRRHDEESGLATSRPAASWHDDVFVPGVDAVDRAGLKAAFPCKTEADLFLWVYDRRRDLRVVDPDATFADAGAYALDEGVGRRDRMVIRAEAARPLPGS